MDGDALILLHPKGGISVPAAAGLRSQHQFPLQTTTLQTTSLPPLRSASMPKQKLFDDKKPKARKQSNSPTPKLNLESI